MYKAMWAQQYKLALRKWANQCKLALRSHRWIPAIIHGHSGKSEQVLIDREKWCLCLCLDKHHGHDTRCLVMCVCRQLCVIMCVWIYMDIYTNYYTYISYIIYIYRSCLQGYRGTFKDESLMTIRDLREQRLVENSLIRGGVVPLLEHDHPRLARAARTCAPRDL